jgi:putative salt-induced outer membrane protein YdiY
VIGKNKNMKKLIIVLSLFLTSCSQISQRVTYEQELGFCVTTYTNGIWKHGWDDFHVYQYADAKDIDSVKKYQMNLAKEYLKIAD